LAQLASSESALRREMADVLSKACTKDLALQVDQEEEQLSQIKQRLEAMHVRINSANQKPQSAPRAQHRSSLYAMKPKSAAELSRERCPRRMKMRINAMRGEWKQRKDKCVDFVNNISDAMEKKPKDVIKILDVETDEMYGVKMPPKHDVPK